MIRGSPQRSTTLPGCSAPRARATRPNPLRSRPSRSARSTRSRTSRCRPEPQHSRLHLRRGGPIFRCPADLHPMPRGRRESLRARARERGRGARQPGGGRSPPGQWRGSRIIVQAGDRDPGKACRRQAHRPGADPLQPGCPVCRPGKVRGGRAPTEAALEIREKALGGITQTWRRPSRSWVGCPTARESTSKLSSSCGRPLPSTWPTSGRITPTWRGAPRSWAGSALARTTRKMLSSAASACWHLRTNRWRHRRQGDGP